MLQEQLIQAELDCGAAKAALLSGEQIIFSESFRDICQNNQCGCYGKCWTCPPDIGGIEELIARATSLKYINGSNTVTYFGLVLFSE